MTRSPSCVALIPARSGSKRAPGKNIRPLEGHPLLAYTIVAARQSGVFEAIILSTDSFDYAQIAVAYGAHWLERPKEMAGDYSPDIEWVRHAVEAMSHKWTWDCFAILRPTSPFRTAGTIRRAWGQWCEGCGQYDSLRAMEPVKQHPGKMWVLSVLGPAIPYLPGAENLAARIGGQPAHSVPTQALPRVYVQNASLEIAWTRVLAEHGNISGVSVMPFLTDRYEGFDINTELDFQVAEMLVATGAARLPEVTLGT